MASIKPSSPPLSQRTLLFVGTLGYPPNEDAVRWIGASIAPRLRRVVPDIRIVIAGRADPRLQRRMARDGLIYLHAPDDLTEIYAGAAIVIVPLRGGGGTKLKVLEAWQHGRPVVSTSHGMRGLNAESGRHMLIADHAENFAQSCARLLRSPELADHLVRQATDHLQSHFLLENSNVVSPAIIFKSEIES